MFDNAARRRRQLAFKNDGCFSNQKTKAALELLRGCGDSEAADKMEQDMNDGLIACTNEDTKEAVTDMSSSTNTTMLTINCNNNAADLAMQIRGEWYRRTTPGWDEATENDNLKNLEQCLKDNGSPPNRRWWHAPE